MRLLRESPIEFLEPLSKPPEFLYTAEMRGPFCSVVMAGTEEGLVFVRRDKPLGEFSHDLFIEWGINCRNDATPLKRYIERFTAYFDGYRGPFKAAVQPFMITPFTLMVHRVLTRIPFGGALSYGNVANEIGKPGAARAVGNACGRNRTLIVVPCHRVLAGDGIGGFGAGLDLKKHLLRHEGITWRCRGRGMTK